MSNPVELTDRTHRLARRRAKERGAPSLEEYVEALILEDAGVWEPPAWTDLLFEDSPVEIAQKVLDKAAPEGVARAERKQAKARKPGK